MTPEPATAQECPAQIALRSKPLPKSQRPLPRRLPIPLPTACPGSATCPPWPELLHTENSAFGVGNRCPTRRIRVWVLDLRFCALLFSGCASLPAGAFGAIPSDSETLPRLPPPPGR